MFVPLALLERLCGSSRGVFKVDRVREIKVDRVREIGLENIR